MEFIFHLQKHVFHPTRIGFFFPLAFDLGTMSLKLSEPKERQYWIHFLDILLKIPSHDKFWLLEDVWKILTYSEAFLLFSLFSEVQAIGRNRGRCLPWSLEALSACLQEKNILHERKRKLGKWAFKRMLSGRTEWRGMSGCKWVTTQ